ncbi:MAG: NAD-dependent epimerase/dehydratase family protein [Opitutus sp.]|nr:NAD-dependent epimerase/dehydratase family protein [Opitutus sp.]
MKLLLTGGCGFVGSTLAKSLLESTPGLQLIVVDNFSRQGSETNRAPLEKLGVKVIHGDVRSASDLDVLPHVDWVLDAAANPSVLAGIDSPAAARQLTEHNLGGTLNLLDYCHRHGAGMILLSTSRVYSIEALARLQLTENDDAFALDASASHPAGVSPLGVREEFSASTPISLYGATKLASEVVALEYAASLNLRVFVNRCGVLAGAGQFGRPDQGIFSFWINSHLRRRPLKYIGFQGTGHQVRDCLHPRDLVPLLKAQMAAGDVSTEDRLVNVSGGAASAISLRQLTAWCDARFGAHPVAADLAPRRFDVPWLVLDHSRATARWGWKPTITRDQILEEIAEHAALHPDWLALSGA